MATNDEEGRCAKEYSGCHAKWSNESSFSSREAISALVSGFFLSDTNFVEVHARQVVIYDIEGKLPPEPQDSVIE
eukprot:5000323-Amphidinium_carterae.1